MPIPEPKRRGGGHVDDDRKYGLCIPKVGQDMRSAISTWTLNRLIPFV